MAGALPTARLARTRAKTGGIEHVSVSVSKSIQHSVSVLLVLSGYSLGTSRFMNRSMVGRNGWARGWPPPP